MSSVGSYYLFRASQPKFDTFAENFGKVQGYPSAIAYIELANTRFQISHSFRSMKAHRTICPLLLPPLIPGCSSSPQATNTDITSANTTPAEVINTGDGDSLKVRSQDGSSNKVRVGCIDSPEYSQEYGPEAGQRLKALLPSGATIELREIDTDQYGRTVAEVYSEGKSVGLQLVQEGYAVVYHRYLDGCSATADQYVAAEGEARSQRLNFWSQSNPVMPWDYRKSRN